MNKEDKIMNDINYVDKNGNKINVSVIGFFSIPDLEKEYIMYGIIDDDNDDEDGLVLLGEVIRENDTIKILGILPEESEMVVAYYNEISKQIGEAEDE